MKNKWCQTLLKANSAANVTPSISIITPSDNASYPIPATVTITANATDSDGTIRQVDFYSNAILMTTVTAAPYSVTLAGFNLGSYTFTAVATDNNNASTTSATVSISIVNGASQVYYIHTDQLNTPRLITDSNNAKVWEWNNDDPFGNNPPNDDPNATGRHFEYNLAHAGQYRDKETNTFYNYFRDCYDPATGRYCESDPIGLGGGSMSPYVYAEGNPLTYNDPKGLSPPGTWGTVFHGVPNDIISTTVNKPAKLWQELPTEAKCEIKCNLTVAKPCFPLGGKAPGLWKIPAIAGCEVAVERGCKWVCENPKACEAYGKSIENSADMPGP